MTIINSKGFNSEPWCILKGRKEWEGEKEGRGRGKEKRREQGQRREGCDTP